MKFIVLGGYGIIGKAVVADLYKFTSEDSEILIAGRDFKKAKDYSSFFNSKRVKANQINIENNRQLVSLLKQGDVCVNCIQYNHNLKIMTACLNARTNYLDLGGMFHCTKKQLKLNNKFKRIGKTAILGIGGAPGISNILTLYGYQLLKRVNKIEIVFAGKDDTDYQQSFVLPYSFKTLVDELTLRPAVFRNGKTIFAKPISGLKEYDFGVDFGIKKGFLTLHSEIATLPVSLNKKGVKDIEFRVTFPGDFTDKISELVNLGFTSQKPVNSGNTAIVDVTSRIMDKLIPKPGTTIKDKEIIRVLINNKLKIDALTESNGKESAGVLDTAIPCSIASIMLASGLIKDPGVFPPERIINPIDFFKELKRRKITILKNGKTIN